MKPTENLRGRYFGNMFVFDFAGMHPRAFWYCRCSCGTELVVAADGLKSGNSQSCGHTRSRGLSKDGKKTPEYRAWDNMVSRCERKSARSYYNYGGRGIKVCDRWRYGEEGRSGPECFVADLGMRPTKFHTLERNDTDGNYEPSNCCWVTKKAQARNRRNNRWVSIDGKKTILEDAITELRVNRMSFYRAFNSGSSVVESLRRHARVEKRITEWPDGLGAKGKP
jgi:hypothetical protein